MVNDPLLETGHLPESPFMVMRLVSFDLSLSFVVGFRLRYSFIHSFDYVRFFFFFLFRFIFFCIYD